MATAPSILLCESPSNIRPSLADRLCRAGVNVELAQSVPEAEQLLSRQFYDGVALDLLLPDRDGISFALEIRRAHPDLPVMVLTTRYLSNPPAGIPADPDWLDRTANQARMMFALKQASQRTAGVYPRVLHVESDDFQAELVNKTVGRQARMLRVRSVSETEFALTSDDFDLALINLDSDCSIPYRALHLLENQRPQLPLVVNAGPDVDPMATIIWTLTGQFEPEPQAAGYC